VNSLIGYSQTAIKPVLGVAEFTSEVNSKYSGAVAEKVVQIVTNKKLNSNSKNQKPFLIVKIL
jgi:hypothetical protein